MWRINRPDPFLYNNLKRLVGVMKGTIIMETTYDVIVIGGGTAGMMAAIAAAEAGARTLLIEKNKRLGKKLLMTGGGRCNVTNRRPVADLIQHIPGNGKFLYSTFAQWNNEDIIAFFEGHGVALKEEDHGRMFPTTDKSKTIVDTLTQTLKQHDVTLLMQTEVSKLLHDGQQIQGVRTTSGEFKAACVIVTTGGKTYPSTGATGSGYQLAKQVGHQVTPLYPTESPLISEAAFIKNGSLQGLSLRDISLSVLNQQGKPVVTHQMDLLFTHFGLSGPAALRCSYFVNQALREGADEVILQLDLFPEDNETAVLRQLEARTANQKSVKNALRGLVPERLLQFYLDKLGLQDLTGTTVTSSQLLELANLLKGFEIPVARTFGLEKSFVTGGGISLKEITPKTMESKQMAGLFFAGEVLDINGYTGGYNITAAFCTGHVAGTHAAEIASYTY